MILTGAVGLAGERAAAETNQGKQSHTQCWSTGADEIKDSLQQSLALKLWNSSGCGKCWAQLHLHSVVFSTERGRTAENMKQFL